MSPKRVKWQQMKNYIANIQGSEFTTQLYNQFNPDDTSIWLEKPAVDFVRHMRPYLINSASQIQDLVKLAKRSSNFISDGQFDIQSGLTLERLLTLIFADAVLINCTTSMLEVNWQLQVMNENNTLVKEIINLDEIFKNALKTIYSSNQRMKKWTHQILNNPDLDSLKTLDASPNFTFKYIVESILSNIYIIDIIIISANKFIKKYF